MSNPDTHPHPAVSVIVPAKDAESTIRRTVTGLARQDLSLPYEVIVVDNASSDETAAVAGNADPAAILLREEGSGAGRARNTGARAARAPILAFTDADCEPHPRWLSSALAALADTDIVQGVVIPDPDAPMRPFDHTVRVSGEHGLYETANLVVRREWFDHVGGFRDGTIDRGRPFGEDVLFAWQAKREGARSAFAPDAIVHHSIVPRGPVPYLRERTRLQYFAALAKQVPELRGTTFFARFFLSPRSAGFDLALASVLACFALGSLVPLLGALPYAWMALADAWQQGRKWRIPVLAVGVAADAISLAALVWGSLRWKTLLL